MQIDIKCAECGKMTRKFELGNVCYSVENPSETFRVVNKIICPKCKKDISNEKCLIEQNELLFSIMAANIGLWVGASVPRHLRGIKMAYRADLIKAKSKPLLVKRFYR
ncbi:MAG: hypothetical protein QME12_08795 [Nanoarchaeota archaeon]|nr:hypothetical protein [Nanoarchaeota archaeon]